MTIKPPHPGETIKEDYLAPLGMSVNQLAKALGDHRRYRPTAGSLLRHERGVLAQPAIAIRLAGGGAENARED